MKIKAYAARYNMTKGESPLMLINVNVAEDWFGRDPFEEVTGIDVEAVSDNLLMEPGGTTDGHNLIRDSMFTDSLRMDKFVPLSPLFVKDLAGRTVYIGYGPERKGNVEWNAYAVDVEKIDKEDLNPFIPLVVFPRFCRDASAVEGEELLEHVFLTKFRCLEMSMGFNGQLSGADEDDPLISVSYLGANLYPYKLRLDTFYIDGYKLPQTQMLYARGMADGVSPAHGRKLGTKFLQEWQQRPPEMDYEAWIESLGEERLDELFESGCTVIPTFEACNGYHVVGPNFELEDFWPGRAVPGLHDVMEVRQDSSPSGTILEVIEPGFVTADFVVPAKVVMSDGSGYVSPNASDPDPLVPNHNFPHPRTTADWRATWLPTHPLHFEAPALWGWDVATGRFVQLSGPLWDPLHYYYASVDKVLAAFEATPLGEDRKGLVLVPAEMENRFFPIVPMTGFDTFSNAEYVRRYEKHVLPQSCLKRVPTEDYTAGLGYHPLPAEFEFELDPFWFPELHPLNREILPIPNDVEARISPIIGPQVTISDFIPTVDTPDYVTWMTDELKLFTPVADPLVNYPHMMRYLASDVDIDSVVKLCPVPYLREPGDVLTKPAKLWWVDEDGLEKDSPLALEDLIPGVHDALWDIREKGVDLVKFRHMIYRTNLPLYMLAWWYGWSVDVMQQAFADWVEESERDDAQLANMLSMSVR